MKWAWRATVAFGVMMTACSSSTAQLRSELGSRASSQLKCPENQLEYQELDRLISTTKVQVNGCHRKATYEMIESQWRLTRDERKGVLAP